MINNLAAAESPSCGTSVALNIMSAVVAYGGAPARRIYSLTVADGKPRYRGARSAHRRNVNSGTCGFASGWVAH